MPDVDFLSEEWIAALDAAARARPRHDNDPLRTVTLTIDQVVEGGRAWRLSIDRGSMAVSADLVGEPDVRLTSDRETAASIASGRRPALDAFISGDLRLGGDVRVLLEHRQALESVGDLFAEVRAATDFD